MSIFVRTEILLKDKFKNLSGKHVAVFGVGGVGGNCIETLARSGIQELTIIDNDSINESNINRQIIALHSTIGKDKVEVMKDRLLDINPSIVVHTKQLFVSKETIDEIDFTVFDYVVDAIDTISAKILVVKKCNELGVSIISSMGAGNRLDPTKLSISTLDKTSYCPLAKVMRRELKKLGIYKTKVLYSTEEAIQPDLSLYKFTESKVIGSVAFVANTAGILIASEVISDLLKTG